MGTVTSCFSCGYTKWFISGLYSKFFLLYLVLVNFQLLNNSLLVWFTAKSNVFVVIPNYCPEVWMTMVSDLWVVEAQNRTQQVHVSSVLNAIVPSHISTSLWITLRSEQIKNKSSKNHGLPLRYWVSSIYHVSVTTNGLFLQIQPGVLTLRCLR